MGSKRSTARPPIQTTSSKDVTADGTGRVLVIGAGALGSIFAAKLSRSGLEVQALDAHPEHVRLLREPGVQVNEVGSEWTCQIDAYSSVEELTGPFEFGLITLKSTALESALTPLVEAGLVETFVSLGNGLVQERIADLTEPGQLVAGTVSWGATNLGPGRVAQTTVAPIAVGELDGTRTARIDRLAEVLSPVAEIHVTDRITGQVWSKLLLNSTFSGMGVVSGLLYSEAVSQPRGDLVAYGLWTEGYDVARAAGLELDQVAGIDPAHLVVRSPADLDVARSALDSLMGRIGATKASMLQDLDRRISTEVRVINGGVSSTAARLGVPSPLNDRIVEMVEACERGEAMPTPDAIEELAGLLPNTIRR